MRRAIARRVPRVGPVVLIVAFLIAGLLSAPAVVPAHASTADRSVTLTLKCTNSSCSGSWFWHQGGLTGPLLGSGSIAGAANSTTRATTIQPAAADTLNFGVSTGDCGQGFVKYITQGSAVNFTAKVPNTDSDRDQICAGGGSTFSMKS
jgi:hypothetical protein